MKKRHACPHEQRSWHRDVRRKSVEVDTGRTRKTRDEPTKQGNEKGT